MFLRRSRIRIALLRNNREDVSRGMHVWSALLNGITPPDEAAYPAAGTASSDALLCSNSTQMPSQLLGLDSPGNTLLWKSSDGIQKVFGNDATENGLGDATPVLEGTPEVLSQVAGLSGDAVVAEVAELGYWPSHIAIQSIEYLHCVSGLPYWASIVAFTLALRTMLLPVAIKTMQNSSRMAIMKPELELVTERIKADPQQNDPKRQAMYRQQMQALFAKHQCSPFKSLLMPMCQIPIFMSCFFGLRQMGDYFPDFAEGGTLWFTDLTASDPTYIFPVVTAATFILMVEIGADGMQQQGAQAQQFKMIMRGMGVMMVPMTYFMPCGVFCYWSAANTFSLTQQLLLKAPGVRDMLQIPLPPPPPEKKILDKVDPMANPLTTILAQARGETLNKQAVASEVLNARIDTLRGDDGSLPPGAGQLFDEKHHRQIKVLEQPPKRK